MYISFLIIYKLIVIGIMIINNNKIINLEIKIKMSFKWTKILCNLLVNKILIKIWIRISNSEEEVALEGFLLKSLDLSIKIQEDSNKNQDFKIFKIKINLSKIKSKISKIKTNLSKIKTNLSKIKTNPSKINKIKIKISKQNNFKIISNFLNHFLEGEEEVIEEIQEEILEFHEETEEIEEVLILIEINTTFKVKSKLRPL